MNRTDPKSAWRKWAASVDRVRWSHDVSSALADWPPLHGTVLSYLAMRDEVDLQRVHDLERCRIAVTRTPESGPLTVHRYVPADLEQHVFGFSQPSHRTATVALDAIDMVLVPGLVFDRLGNRLGRGRGYYDRLLGQLPIGVVRVGVAVDELLVEGLPVEAHDQRIDWIATETGMYRVGDDLPEATERFIARAIPRGIAPDIHRFPSGTRTSKDAAAAVGATLGEIAKSILFMADDQPVLVLASGDCRINEEKLAAAVGASRARIASLDTVREVTGFVAGGTPGVGLPKNIKVVADGHLGRYRWVWSAGGTPDTVYPVALDRLIAASGARWSDVADRGRT